jgi:hypothetical protein
LKKVYFLHESSLWPMVTLGVAAAALVSFLIFKNMS